MVQNFDKSFLFSHMLIRGEFPRGIFQKSALTHKKASFYYQYNYFFPKKHYPTREENFSYLHENTLLRA